jgi:hypothetical protein
VDAGRDVPGERRQQQDPLKDPTDAAHHFRYHQVDDQQDRGGRRADLRGVAAIGLGDRQATPMITPDVAARFSRVATDDASGSGDLHDGSAADEGLEDATTGAIGVTIRP